VTAGRETTVCGREEEGDAAAAIRAFIAIELDDAARAAVDRLSRALRAAPGGERVRWVRSENLHMTLRFLGNVASERVPAIVRCVGEAVADLGPFRMRLGRVTAFPSPRRPQVLALEVGPAAPLARLAAAVEAAVVRAGLAAESRGFRPHLTLGRLRGRAIPRVTVPVTAEGEAVEVEEIVLFRSELTGHGAIHTPLARIALGGSDHP
jgi:2'-5' RNA ligase